MQVKADIIPAERKRDMYAAEGTKSFRTRLELTVEVRTNRKWTCSRVRFNEPELGVLI